MKILHCADLHIGVTANGKHDMAIGFNTRVLDCLGAFDFMIGYAEDNDVDAVLFAGDVFHTNYPSPAFISEFSFRIGELLKICPVVIIPGNHDMAARRVSAVEYIGAMGVSGLYVLENPSYMQLHTKSGDLMVFGVPYPNRKQYDLSDGSLEAIRGAVHAKLDEFADMSCNSDLPCVLMGHFAVENSFWNSSGKAVASDEAEVMLENLLGCWNYVALGHLHYYQNLVGGMDIHPIIYSGSMERLDFGEEGDVKGFVEIIIDGKDSTSYKFIEYTRARKFKTFYFDVYGDDDVNDVVSSYVKTLKRTKQTIARIIIKTDKHTSLAPTYPLLEKMFYNYVVHIEVDRPDRIRLSRDDAKSLLELSDAELVKTYLELSGHDDTRLLLKLFADIKKDVL